MALSLFKKCISGCLRSSVARLVWIQKASSEASVTGVSLSRITLYPFFLLLFLSIKLFLFIIIHHIFFIPSSSSSVKILTDQCHGRPLHKSQTFFLPRLQPWIFVFLPFQFSQEIFQFILRLDFTSHKHFSSLSSLDLGFSPFPVFSGNIPVNPPSSDLISQVTNIFLPCLQPWIFVFLPFQFSQKIFQFILHLPT